MVTLAADASNIQEWKFLADSTVAGHCTTILLSREPIARNQLELEMAAHFKTLLAFTVDRAFLAELASKSAHQAWEHLLSVVPHAYILQVSRLKPVHLFEYYQSPNEYVSKHHQRHNLLVTADSGHFLA